MNASPRVPAITAGTCLVTLRRLARCWTAVVLPPNSHRATGHPDQLAGRCASAPSVGVPRRGLRPVLGAVRDVHCPARDVAPAASRGWRSGTCNSSTASLATLAGAAGDDHPATSTPSGQSRELAALSRVTAQPGDSKSQPGDAQAGARSGEVGDDQLGRLVAGLVQCTEPCGPMMQRRVRQCFGDVLSRRRDGCSGSPSSPITSTSVADPSSRHRAGRPAAAARPWSRQRRREAHDASGPTTGPDSGRAANRATSAGSSASSAAAMAAESCSRASPASDSSRGGRLIEAAANPVRPAAPARPGSKRSGCCGHDRQQRTRRDGDADRLADAPTASATTERTSAGERPVVPATLRHPASERLWPRNSSSVDVPGRAVAHGRQSSADAAHAVREHGGRCRPRRRVSTHVVADQRHPQPPIAWAPPSTCTIDPVVAGNQGDNRAMQARAVGSAVVDVPPQWRLLAPTSLLYSEKPGMPLAAGVWMGPAATRLTRTPRGPSSRAR